MERRPILLSSVMLRQNPHNVHEWHKRVKLFNGQPHKQILTYTEAVTTVDVEKVSMCTSPKHLFCSGCTRHYWGLRVFLNMWVAAHSCFAGKVCTKILTPTLLLAGCRQAAHALDCLRKVLRTPWRH